MQLWVGAGVFGEVEGYAGRVELVQVVGHESDEGDVVLLLGFSLP